MIYSLRLWLGYEKWHDNYYKFLFRFRSDKCVDFFSEYVAKPEENITVGIKTISQISCINVVHRRMVWLEFGAVYANEYQLENGSLFDYKLGFKYQ